MRTGADDERGLTRRWRARTNTDDSAGGGSIVDRVLRARGLHDPETAGSFLDPRLTDLHDPSRIPELDRAGERLLDAARSGEPIVIYGDYDVDGITATSVLYHTLLAVAPGANVSTYVPHRLDEGYGVNAEALETLANQGAKVVVTVDCGITAIHESDVAKARGLDLIITDHHNPPASTADLPDAFAVVHPRHPDSDYPFGDLCGAGVAFKLAWRIATCASGSERVSDDLRALLVSLLAPTALGVIADVVPLLGENRVIARHGLGRVKHSSIPGLRALVEASRLSGNDVSAEDVGFRIAPRINACGRMGHAGEAVELLTTATGPRARAIAQMLSKLNDDRRATEVAILKQAEQLAERSGMTSPDRRAIVLAHEDWHPGVIGIVCSRLVDRHARPTILMQHQGDVCVGSGRSVDRFNLHGALEQCSDLLERFGGHDMAAGLRVAPDKLEAFTERFTSIANESIGPEDLTHDLHVDCRAELGELSIESVRGLSSLAPFGRSNPRVRVRVGGLRVADHPEVFGRDSRHLKLRVRDGDAWATVVAWGWAEHKETIPAGAGIDVVVEPKISDFSGRVEPVLEDLRLAT